MEYQLIKPINPSYSALQQILTNRGIKHEQILNYVHSTDDCINAPQTLGKQQLRNAAAALLLTIKQNKSTIVIVDCDCDGYTSAAILINYLHDLFPSYVQNKLIYYVHDNKQHGLSDCCSWILQKNQISLVICPDSSSNDYEQHGVLKEHNITTIVLDHHEAEKISPYAIIINNQLSDYPNKNFSGAGVTWQFCRYLDKLLNKDYANNYLDLVSLGLTADMMSLTNIQTKHLIWKGLKNLHNPFIVYMTERNSYSLKGKINSIGIAFYVAPYVNSMTRSGTVEEKLLLFESMLNHKAFQQVLSTKRGHSLNAKETIVAQAIRVATNVKNRQTKAQDDGLDLIEEKIQKQNLLSHKVLLFLLEPGQIDRNIAGLVANKIMAKYQRPVCVLTKVVEDGQSLPWDPPANPIVSYQGSARGCDKIGVTDFKSICQQTRVCQYAEGHPGAFGISVRKQDIPTFINRTDQLLKDINDEAIYYVDYIYKNQYINSDQILEIADMDQFWGKDIDEPYIAIEGLKVTSSMVTIYQKTTNTLKISLQNNISLIKFKATDEQCEKLQNHKGYYEINIIGRCNKNEWNGYVTPQIFIQDYQIVDDSNLGARTAVNPNKNWSQIF